MDNLQRILLIRTGAIQTTPVKKVIVQAATPPKQTHTKPLPSDSTKVIGNG